VGNNVRLEFSWTYQNYVFWDVASCSLVDEYRRLWGISCFHFKVEGTEEDPILYLYVFCYVGDTDICVLIASEFGMISHFIYNGMGKREHLAV
jgi:hypothetical protein